jgi:hypothetical protein
MVDENALSPTPETTISAKVILELAKRFDIHVRHSDVHSCARRLPNNDRPPLCDVSNYGGPHATWR